MPISPPGSRNTLRKQMGDSDEYVVVQRMTNKQQMDFVDASERSLVRYERNPETGLNERLEEVVRNTWGAVMAMIHPCVQDFLFKVPDGNGNPQDRRYSKDLKQNEAVYDELSQEQLGFLLDSCHEVNGMLPEQKAQVEEVEKNSEG